MQLNNRFNRILEHFLSFLFLFSVASYADAISSKALANGGAVIRDLQLKEVRDILRGGRGGYIDMGFNYLPLPSQTPLESEFGEHDGFAFRHHFAGFGSGEISKNHHLGLLLWFERSGWDAEDFLFFPSYNDFSIQRSVTTWGLTYTQSSVGLTMAGGMQHQNVEHVGAVYPHENDSLLYSWAHLRYGHVSVQGSFHRKDWRSLRISMDLESRSIYGGQGSTLLTYLPNVDVSLYNGGDSDDSVRVFWEQNLIGQVLYGELAFDFPSKEFHSAALKFYPDPSRMVALEATCLRRITKSGEKDLLWGGGIELPFIRVAYNSSYDYETFFNAKGTWILEFQFNLATIDGLLFARGGTRSAPMETMKLNNKKNTEFLSKEKTKTLDATGVRFEKSSEQGESK